MKYVYGVCIALASTIATAQGLNGEDAVQTMNETHRRVMESVCSSGSDMSRSAQCYLTPSGKRVYELPEGADRTYWMKVGKKEHERYIREKMQKRKQYADEAERRFQAEQVNAQHCQFWQEQAPSERRSRKIGKYCQ